MRIGVDSAYICYIASVDVYKKRVVVLTRRKKIYEGKAKILYEGTEPGTLIAHFKDDATAFNNQKRGQIEGKGALNNRISEYLMTRLDGIGIPNHFIRRINMREQLIHKVEIIPLEMVCRNIAAGTICKRFGLKEGAKLPRPIIEYYLKDDDLGDPLVGDDHISAFGWASPQEMDDMISMTFRVNDFLCGLFGAIGIQLIDFKLEFGRQFEGDMVRTILADEISPDCCRLWDIETNRKLDKDRFRQDLGEAPEAYAEVARRLGVLKEQPNLTLVGEGSET